MSEFWRLAHQRALDETRKALKIRERIISILVGLAVWWLLVWYFFGGIQDFGKDVIRLAVLFLVPILTYPITYGIKLVEEAAKMYKEVTEDRDDKGRQLEALRNARTRLTLSYTPNTSVNRGNHSMTHINAMHEGDDVRAQIRIVESRFRATGSETWVNTDIRASHNMSWGHLDEDNPEKYSSTLLSGGVNELVDFITCPAVDNFGVVRLDNRGRRGFTFRLHPRVAAVVQTVFYEPGTYRFSMRLSASGVRDQATLTLLVDWDGQTATIRSEDGQVLETI
jgi:hypothetical protein